MRDDLELWARGFVELYDWRERSTWFNVRLRDVERYLAALRQEAPCIIESRPPYQLEDVQRTIGAMQSTLQGISDRLAAIVEMRERAGK